MKFSLSWLKDHLDTDADAQGVADALNRIGHEVESIDNPAEKLSAFRIARVLTAAPHPQADKLQVLSVDAGGEPLQVVCGAPNARAGMLGVFGPAGAVVPANGMVLKVAAIRGVESNGMMCSIACVLAGGRSASGANMCDMKKRTGSRFSRARLSSVSVSAPSRV